MSKYPSFTDLLLGRAPIPTPPKLAPRPFDPDDPECDVMIGIEQRGGRKARAPAARKVTPLADVSVSFKRYLKALGTRWFKCTEAAELMGYHRYAVESTMRRFERRGLVEKRYVSKITCGRKGLQWRLVVEAGASQTIGDQT